MSLSLALPPSLPFKINLKKKHILGRGLKEREKEKKQHGSWSPHNEHSLLGRPGNTAGSHQSRVYPAPGPGLTREGSAIHRASRGVVSRLHTQHHLSAHSACSSVGLFSSSIPSFQEPCRHWIGQPAEFHRNVCLGLSLKNRPLRLGGCSGALGAAPGRLEQQMLSYLHAVRCPFCTQVTDELGPLGGSGPLNGVFFPELPICLAFSSHLCSAVGGKVRNTINK